MKQSELLFEFYQKCLECLVLVYLIRFKYKKL